ncbi:MAG: protein translocase subunit SecF, partial [Lachnospiraceae bacterium]|nr:protein translocase subunit SecF [Lachnospiraceae bacterium]
IVDGNITTLIAAGILWIMGSGPIQGFAKTLAFGIVISMVTALVVTRVLLYCLYYMGFNKASMYGVQKRRKLIDFVGKKVVLFGISGLLIVGGIVAMFVRSTPFNLSVEFQGGVSTTVEFEKAYNIAEFNADILPKIQAITGDGDVMANEVSGTNQFVIRTKELSIEVQEKVESMLIKDFGAIEGTFERTSVSASVSEEMLGDAVLATGIAVVCMLLYIFIRFRDIRFASSAILALVHDIALVILFYSVSWTTVGNTFIACILTILGYSINATIVIFDRIREKLKDETYTGDCKQLVNEAITDTLTRSIYTSLTTFVTVAALYILGVTAMKEFALPLMVGIVAGAYSSVCVTGPLWYLMARKKHAAGGYIPKDDED